MTCGVELLLLTEMNGALPYLFGWPLDSVPSGVLAQSRVAVITDIVVERNRAVRGDLEVARAGIDIESGAGDSYVAARAVAAVDVDLSIWTKLAESLVLIKERFLLHVRQQSDLPRS